MTRYVENIVSILESHCPDVTLERPVSKLALRFVYQVTCSRYIDWKRWKDGKDGKGGRDIVVDETARSEMTEEQLVFTRRQFLLD